MKKLILITLLMILHTSQASAFTLLTNTNDIRRLELTDENGVLHLEWLAKLKTDGMNKTHSENRPQQKFTDEEKLKMYEYLGTDFMIQEGLPMEKCLSEYERAIDLVGYLDSYMIYNECNNESYMREAR